MSRRTAHYTPRQRAALNHEAHIKRQVRLVNRHWQIAAPHFGAIMRERLYEELDFANFGAWCESIGVSPSHGYALAQIDGLPEQVQNSLQGIGLGKAKLILPQIIEALHDAEENIPRETKSFDETIESVNELIESAQRMTWHDLRQEMNGDDAAPHWVAVQCPRCKKNLRASRAVVLETE